MSKKQRTQSVDLGRHEAACNVCSHAQREDIEREWLNWGSAEQIAADYGLSRDSLYRHAHALGLFAKRQRNIRRVLERLLEKAGDVEVTAASVVAAVQAYAKINAQGQWVDRSESVNLNELFDRMSREELERYAREGALPGWFSELVGATPLEDQGDSND